MKKCFVLILVTIILCSTLVPISANEMSYDDPPFAVTFSPNSFEEGVANSNGSRVVILPEDFGDGTGYPTTTYSKNVRDGGLYLSFVVQELGDGCYLYTIDANWVQMPSYRGIDAIAACVDESSVINGTKTGWYSYDKTIYGADSYAQKGNILSSETITTEIPRANLQTKNFYGWQGVCTSFSLPTDTTPFNSDAWAYVDYTDFKIHIEFEAKVKRHEEAISFNAAGSYHHSNVTYNIQPTLTLTDKAGSVAVTISENTEVNPTIAELDRLIDYVPGS